MIKSEKKTGQKTEVEKRKSEKKNSGKEKSDYSFTFEHEIGKGKWDSRKPHWPGGKSGVTIGPGYDMGERTKDQILKDLKKAGFHPEIAKELSGFAGIKPDAKKWKELKDKWIEKHKKENVITREQEKALFDNVLVSEYEDKAKKVVGEDTWDKLSADQKKMLFDYSYNPGLGAFPNFTKAVVKEDWEGAVGQYKRYEFVEKDGKKLIEKYMGKNEYKIKEENGKVTIYKPLKKRNEDFKKKYLDPKVKGREKGEEKKTKKCGARCKYFEEYGYCDRLVYNPPCWQHRA